MLSLPHFLDNQLTDGGQIVSLMHRPPFTPRKIPGTHFCQRLSQHQGHNVTGRIRSIENPVTSSEIEPATFQRVL
jgi:hypothetical protein